MTSELAPASARRTPASSPDPAAASAQTDAASLPEPAAAAWRYEGPILSGVDCGELKAPTWVLDAAERRVAVSIDPSTAFELPPGWEAVLEQPRLLVIRGPAAAAAFRPTFELFIGPRCARVDGPAVHARIAARAWADVQAPAATYRAVKQGRWSASLGGIGDSVILEVTLDTPAGTQAASLYFTTYGRAKTFGIYAAAACPGPIPPVATEGPCQRAYRTMLE